MHGVDDTDDVKEILKPTFGKRSARAYDVAEADMLREFYKRWEALHEISNDAHNRKRKEQAAQSLVDQAHILRRLYAN